ncbi:MAG: hypothetical protein KJO41_03560 [Bacteroidia bacterium]|nr:hypothetical protein [Bacteroidia bacterium]NND26837.1 hypothetical protein [Flavobacteriaceae bacterium]MBT8278053.1 hypothetical protein [Bacteroidia bacterium]NNK61265.1 hypothetical protein [Flavobacteriaceae bacterium]NNL32692.1 hypothetical protein [Flavobacteriaceae bacterium]
MKLKFPHLVVLVLYLFTFTLNAQSNDQRQPLPLANYDQNVNAPLTSSERLKLEEVYGNKLQSYVLSQPERLKAIKNILRNRVQILEFANSKDQKQCTLLSEVSLFDYYVNDLQRDQQFNKHTFNPLKYNFDFYSRGSHLYRVDNTSYYILIKSQH